MHLFKRFHIPKRKKSPEPAAEEEPHEQVKYVEAIVEECEGVGNVYAPLIVEQQPLPSNVAEEEFHDCRKYKGAIPEDHGEAEGCTRGGIETPKPLPPEMLSRLSQEGCRLWTMVSPDYYTFKGRVESGADGVTTVFTDKECQDACIFSNWPIMAGLCDVKEQKGVYYEIVVKKREGTIIMGSACLPYHQGRFPGRTCLSAGFYLEDFRNSSQSLEIGGEDKLISAEDSIGFGYEFKSSTVFFTYKGKKLQSPFERVYVSRKSYDVYSAIGVNGKNEFEVNFGMKSFMWEEGNDRAWKVEGLFGAARDDGNGVP